MQVVGFDPGGANAFGWAVLDVVADRLSSCKAGTCSTAPAAMNAVSALLLSPPAAIGIDAPLFWVTQGDRLADRTVRSLLRGTTGSTSTVNHVNSLRGACLAQGVIVAMLARAEWPATEITESHPKALFAVSARVRAFCDEWTLSIGSQHARDASIAAYSAFAFITHSAGWNDLASHEQSAIFVTGARVAYWFPAAGD